MIKKSIALLLAMLLMVCTVVGCKTTKNTTDASSEEVGSEEVSSEEVVSEEDDVYDESSEEPVSVDETPEILIPPEEPEEPQGYVLSAAQKRAEEIKSGTDEQLNKSSLYSSGNLARLAKAINKSKSGQTVTLAFFGGCNTANNTISGYADIVSSWWKSNIGPCSTVVSGLSAMTSVVGCMRVEHDVLQYKPDVVFLDFAVQDNYFSASASNTVAFDNLIRRVLYSKTNPAVVTLLLTGAEQKTFTLNVRSCNPFVSTGTLQKKVSAYYNLPVIDMEETLWDIMYSLYDVKVTGEQPVLFWDSFCTDNVTLNDAGHTVLAGMIDWFLKDTLNKLGSISTKDDAVKSNGYFGNDAYMKGSFVDIQEMTEGTAAGYKLLEDRKKLTELGYIFEFNRAAQQKYATYPSIRTSQHYIATSEADKDLETNPMYLTYTLPDLSAHDQLYFLSSSHPSVAKDPTIPFGPVTYSFYDSNDNLIGSQTGGGGTIPESVHSYKLDRTKIPANARKIIISVYCSKAFARLQGIGIFDK